MSTGTTTGQWARLQGQSVFDNAGQKIGDIQRVFFDQTNEPAWVAVRGPGMGEREAFVPLTGSRMGQDGLGVAVGADVVRAAPAIEADSELSVGDAAQLNRFYENELSAPPMPSPEPPVSVSTSAPANGPADENRAAQLTSYEEQLRVGTEEVSSGAVRLHKSVTTEQVDTSVPVSHEEVRVERSPATENPVPGGHRFEEQAVEVTLHEERPTIAKETVPVETVRLATETRTDDRRIGDQVRRERIEVDDERQPGDQNMPRR